MKPDEKYVKLFSNCIPVKGAKRSIICDVQRKDIQLIPNDLYEILANYENKTIREIKLIFNNNYDDIIDEYFEFLLEKEFIFFTGTPERFPQMNMQFHYPFKISNAIIDRNKKSEYDMYKVLDQLEKLKCKFLEIRFFDGVDLPEIEKILNYLNTRESIIASVGILIPFSEDFEEKKNELSTKFPRLSCLIVHNAKGKKTMPPAGNSKEPIIYTEEKITNEKGCGVINTSYFTSNIPAFTESLKHNSCLNRKLSIDVNGHIKNCPSMTQSFGHIKDTSLEEALHHKDFKKYWNITKDKIEVCKDCEFRYICTDCRAYLENPENEYSKPLKCGYNPYTNVWEDWSANPLKQKAIDFYGLRDLIEK